MNTIHLQLINDCKENLLSLENMSPMVKQKTRIAELDQKISDPNLWNDPNNAGLIMKERVKIFKTVSYLTQSKDHVEYYEELIHSGTDLDDKEAADLFKINSQLSLLVFQSMMSDTIDKNAAILSISAGAGGSESANWVTMLLRMYVRYALASGFTIELLDKKPSEDHGAICTDHVSIMISGDYAYGFFKSESGIHRLVRQSPFNAAGARQTSFAAVSVTSDIEDSIDIKIEDKDIEITCMPSGGPGGQHSNKVSSCVRLKYFPAGIQIVVRTERDQHANRKTAMKMLKAKLYDIELKKKQDEQDKYTSALSNAAFGSQIRSYIEMPQALTKDHRTKYEVNNFDSVLDGDIKGFMLAYLKWKASSNV